MKTLHNYLTRELTIAIGLSVTVFALALLVGQIIDQLQQILSQHGLSVSTLFKFLPLLLPYVLMFALPMSVITAMMLVFGKLSADNELTALRSSGLSVPRLVWPAFLLAVGLAIFCLFLNTTLAPWCKEKFKTQIILAALRQPHLLLEPGETIYFGRIRIYVAERSENRIENVRVYLVDDANKVRQTVRAASGTLHPDIAKKQILVELHDVTIEVIDSSDPTKVRTGINAATYPLVLDASKLMSQGFVRKKNGDLTFAELLDAILLEQQKIPSENAVDADKSQKKIWALSVEAQKRFSWALTCIVFTLLGVPLGIRTHRRDTSINAGLALLLVGLYYFLTVLAGKWEDRSLAIASFWLWLPNTIFAVVGVTLFWRVSRT